MGDIGNAVKYLYQQFILRDVLSFVTPGVIVVWIAISLFQSELLEQSIHWLLYIPIFGVLYVVGFAVQCLGEILGMRMKREMRGTLKQRLNILKPKNWDVDDNIWWRDAFIRDHTFFEATKSDEGAQQGREGSLAYRCITHNGLHPPKSLCQF